MASEARRWFEAALELPENLGEATHLLANQSDIYYFLGEACAALWRSRVGTAILERATTHQGDFRK